MSKEKIVVERLELHLEEIMKLGEEYTSKMTPPPKFGESPDYVKLLREVMIAEQFGETIRELVMLYQTLLMDNEAIEKSCKDVGKTPQEMALAIMIDSVMK